MKKLVQTVLLLLSFFYIQVQAQTDSVTITEATTRDGKTVILKSDRIWTYKSETNSETDTKQNKDGFATVYFFRVKEASRFVNRDRGVNLDDREIFKTP